MRAVERKEDSKPKSFLSSIMKREVKTVDRVVLDTSLRRELIMCQDLLEYSLLTGAF